MKEQELLFLGLLQDGPKHGYQLKKLLREIASTFAGLKTASIYYPLKKMLKDALVTRASSKESKRPLRYTYKITSKGKEEFKKLLLKNLLTIERPYFSLDLSLYFLKYIPRGLGERYLKIRLKFLQRIKKGLEELKNTFSHESPPNLSAIVEHNQELLKAEIAFVNRLIS